MEKKLKNKWDEETKKLYDSLDTFTFKTSLHNFTMWKLKSNLT